MAVDTFISFKAGKSGMPEPKGESQDAAFKDESAFEIKDWSFDIENQATLGSATGGAGTGKAKFNEFSITKPTDTASPIFFKNCVAGAHYETVKLSLRKAGADPNSSGKPFLVYQFKTVFTTKISWKNNTEEGPEETINFVYGELKIQYFKQDSAGQLSGSPQEVGWSQITNKAT
jgi:type VI secretion system secreted protein Hcp